MLGRSGLIRWVGYKARTGEVKTAYKRWSENFKGIEQLRDRAQKVCNVGIGLRWLMIGLNRGFCDNDGDPLRFIKRWILLTN